PLRPGSTLSPYTTLFRSPDCPVCHSPESAGNLVQVPASESTGTMAAIERNPALARIRTAMIERKITQAELADAADCHPKTVQNLLNGRPVRDQTLFDVCMVLGLDFDDIKGLLHSGLDRDEPWQPGHNS